MDVTGAMERFEMSAVLFQVSTHQVDKVLGEFGRDLFLGSVDEVKANVRLEDFAHQAVNSSTDCGEQHQLTAAVFIGVDQTLDSFELAAQAAHALEQFQFFAVMQGHGKITSCRIPTPGIV